MAFYFDFDEPRARPRFSRADKEPFYKAQGGKCAICKRKLPIDDYRELLWLVTEPVDWRGSTEGSRRWRAIAKRAVRGYFYEREPA